MPGMDHLTLMADTTDIIPMAMQDLTVIFIHLAVFGDIITTQDCIILV